MTKRSFSIRPAEVKRWRQNVIIDDHMALIRCKNWDFRRNPLDIIGASEVVTQKKSACGKRKRVSSEGLFALTHKPCCPGHFKRPEQQNEAYARQDNDRCCDDHAALLAIHRMA